MRLGSLLAGVAVMVTVSPWTAVSAELEGVSFADQLEVGEVRMDLNCVGLLRHKMIFKAYVAALYVGSGVSPQDVLQDVPKRLELSYFWSIDGADFGNAGDRIIARNIDKQALARLRPRIAQINALYGDVKPGDRYSLTYVPGVGTELALNGQRKGVIEGADFAAAYFRIWLGDHPIDASFRDRLLRCGENGRAGIARSWEPHVSVNS